ncbi:hypothetical protein pEaSNUABM37_00355 [Erwinia phage pEa_SNUABM_37]|nr:hypothetical protein pEaSNUABM37_00355 [Erwinia phage pEa_SNUABM_37]QXO10823.1 hypothetical protein pEaSNUABM48_00355 [Erwinia phage pEa_SNUABM_48]
MLESIFGGKSSTPGLGPGPGTPTNSYTSSDGKKSTKYYGQLTPSQFITGAALCGAFGITSNGNNPNWTKFELDGRILYWPLVTLNDGTPWSTMYNKGLIYGVDGNGGQTIMPGVNQYRTINIQGSVFLVRLPSISLNTFWQNSAGEVQASEWGRMLWSVDKNTTVNSEDGTKWASLNLGIPGKHSMVQQLNTSQANAMCIGYESVISPSSLGRTTANSNVGWRPILELVQ